LGDEFADFAIFRSIWLTDNNWEKLLARSRIPTESPSEISQVLCAMGIRDKPTAPRSPWQKGHCERLIGSIRRECLDHVVFLGERHLRYLEYYNGARTHLALSKDAPIARAVTSVGAISSAPILGGLHHKYVRI